MTHDPWGAWPLPSGREIPTEDVGAWPQLMGIRYDPHEGPPELLSPERYPYRAWFIRTDHDDLLTDPAPPSEHAAREAEAQRILRHAQPVIPAETVSGSGWWVLRNTHPNFEREREQKNVKQRKSVSTRVARMLDVRGGPRAA